MARTRTSAAPTVPVVAPAPTTDPAPVVLSGVTAPTVVGSSALGLSFETVTIETAASIVAGSTDSNVALAVTVAILTTGDSAPFTVDTLRDEIDRRSSLPTGDPDRWIGKVLGRSSLFTYRTAGGWILLTGTDDYAVGRAALSLAEGHKRETSALVKAWAESVPAMSSESEARATLAGLLLSTDEGFRADRRAALAAAPQPGDKVTGTVVGRKGTKGPKDTPAPMPKDDASRLHAALPILAAVKADGKPNDAILADVDAILAHAVRIALAYGQDVAGTVAALCAE